ncbi:hypothetical protein G6F35_019031 [Rhizopus arrhizus]|nr:hypothetical protein G6F35_019031 [Rhizopus arrhizus]
MKETAVQTHTSVNTSARPAARVAVRPGSCPAGVRTHTTSLAIRYSSLAKWPTAPSRENSNATGGTIAARAASWPSL